MVWRKIIRSICVAYHTNSSKTKSSVDADVIAALVVCEADNGGVVVVKIFWHYKIINIRCSHMRIIYLYFISKKFEFANSFFSI